MNTKKLPNHQKILNNANRIAVVRTDRIGDMVLTLPLCNAIKKNFPNAELSVIARNYTEPLLYKSPALDNYVFTDDFEKGIKDVFTSNKYDAVFFPRPRFDEAAAAFKAGISLRIGSGYRAYSIFFNHRVFEHRKSSERHEAEFNTRLLSSITDKEYETQLVKPIIDKKYFNSVAEILKENCIELDDTFIIIHPGSGGSAYDWDAGNFGLTAKTISEKTNAKVIITGIQSEAEKCRIVETNCPGSVNLCSKINLNEMIALISKAKLLIANSTGILHIAAALDIPVVGLYPNAPHLSQKRWGPYSKKAVVLNPPKSSDKNICDNMSLIAVDEVAEAGIKQLK
ncbi:glycosyltransferase family 9 protein [Bacteroidota bacterium]